ncbi:MAG: oligosaccharide flippase family protein [Prevotella sp.]|nr:oligosaccharide flippase family protein [Prevotella sp.]
MGIKRNVAYSSILTVGSHVCALLTYPYVSRTLGVSSVGIYDFVDSIINYLILFSMLGISACGIREIAANKTNKKKLSQVFTSILSFHLFTTVIAIAILAIAMFTIEELFQYRKLLCIGICKLLFNALLIEWFFTGMENFAYIAKRNLTIRVLYVICIFLFIKEKEDYVLYYILTTSTVVINALVDIIYSRKFVKFSIKEFTLKPYYKTIVSIGTYMIVTSLYTSLNIAWLGVVCGTIQVGYYSTSTRLYTIIIAFFTAFTNVMFPRMSSLLSQGSTKEFWDKISLSVKVLFSFAFPTLCVSAVVGPTLLHFLVGDGFEGSYLPFQIISVLILIIGFEQILVLQILMPMKHDNIILRNSFAGAALAIILNLTIVESMGAVGTALVWLSSEICVFLLSLWYLKNHYNYEFPGKDILRYLLGYLPLAGILYACKTLLPLNDMLILLLAGIITLIYTYYIQLYLLRCPVIIQTINRLHEYVKQRK